MQPITLQKLFLEKNFWQQILQKQINQKQIIKIDQKFNLFCAAVTAATR